MWAKGRYKMPQVVINDTKGLIQQTGAGVTVSNAMSIDGGVTLTSALTTAQGATVVLSQDAGTICQSGVSGSALRYALQITGSATSATANGILLYCTSSATAGSGVVGTNVGLGATVPSGACFIFFDASDAKLKFKVGSTIQKVTSS